MQVYHVHVYIAHIHVVMIGYQVAIDSHLHNLPTSQRWILQVITLLQYWIPTHKVLDFTVSQYKVHVAKESDVHSDV